jgi:hypothetical protein
MHPKDSKTLAGNVRDYSAAQDLFLGLLGSRRHNSHRWQGVPNL